MGDDMDEAIVIPLNSFQGKVAHSLLSFYLDLTLFLHPTLPCSLLILFSRIPSPILSYIYSYDEKLAQPGPDFPIHHVAFFCRSPKPCQHRNSKHIPGVLSLTLSTPHPRTW